MADTDREYAQPDQAKLTSPTILRAERRVLRSLEKPTPFTIRAVSDPRLGDDQIRAVRTVTEGARRVSTVIGPAGAGKTTLLQAVGRAVGYAHRDAVVLCLSATAAQVANEETGLAAHTIASWRIGQIPLPRGGVVIVDEASMVPTLVLEELVAATRKAGCRLTLVGDYAQMGAPEAGGLIRNAAPHPATVHLTSIRRFVNDWERDVSIRLRNRDATVVDTYHDHGRVRAVWSDLAIEYVVDAWQANRDAGHDTIVVADTAAQASEISAVCQQRLINAEQLPTAAVATLADGNTAHIGDVVQTRRNTRELSTSNGHRVLNRDVWRVTGTTADGELVAVNTRAGHTVTITADYAAADVVLAYATTIAGAQGRTSDRSHVLVSPRTIAQSLYVGMTRGRHANTAHVVCDTHDHDELRLGERAPRDAFLAAMQRDSDGNLSAHTIAQRWTEQRPAREAARLADRTRQDAERLWNRQIGSWPAAFREDLARREPEIVRVLARLSTDSDRASVVAQALRLTPSGGTASTDFVNALHRCAAGAHRPSAPVGAQRAGTPMASFGSRQSRACGPAIRLLRTRGRGRERPPDRRATVEVVKRELLEQYRGRWVAVDSAGEVVADADELGHLLERLADLGIQADTVQRVPAVDEPIFVGLS